MLLTLKLADWELVDELPAYVERVRSWGYQGRAAAAAGVQPPGNLPGGPAQPRPAPRAAASRRAQQPRRDRAAR